MNNQMDYPQNEYFDEDVFFEQNQNSLSLNQLFVHKNPCPYKLNQLHQQLPVNPDSCPFEVQKIQQKQETTKDVLETKCVEDIEEQLQPIPKGRVIFGEKIIKKYRQVYKGGKDDTMELNINFKTILVHYFKQLIMLNELNQQEIEHVRAFSTRLPSFNSLVQFYDKCDSNEGIRVKCLELFSSPECIRRVMAGRSQLKTKLQMVKYIQKMRLNLESKGTVYKWKDIIKKI